MLRSFLNIGIDVTWVVEQRGEMIPETPEGLGPNLKRLYDIHFKSRLDAESQFFGNLTAQSLFHQVQTHEVTASSLNSSNTRDFILSQDPELILSYGCHKLENILLDIPGVTKWNIHGGLSPWYRGTATHFWPSYMLEPQFTGMTLHETTSKIDGGDVIFQTSSPVFPADGIHENACRVVSEFSNLFVSRLVNVEVKSIQGISPTTTGRIWTSRMWSPHHLQVVYEKFENKINAYAIENGLDRTKPRLLDVLV